MTALIIPWNAAAVICTVCFAWMGRKPQGENPTAESIIFRSKS